MKLIMYCVTYSVYSSVIRVFNNYSVSLLKLFLMVDFKFIVQEYRRHVWNDVKEFASLVEASEFAEQRALRTLEKTRVIRVDEFVIDTYYFVR